MTGVARQKSIRIVALAELVVAALLLSPVAARAALVVDATVQDVGGGLFHWDFTVENTGPADVVIVSLEAPLGDPAIAGSLTAPAGFIPSYDPGLGFVDFLEDTSLFAVGTTVGGFGFDSTSGPGGGFFDVFTALTDQGVLVEGRVRGVPAPSTVVALALGLGTLGLARGRRIAIMVRRMRSSGRRSVVWVVVALLLLPPVGVQAASHSDAPLIKQDPQANLTDVYAFIGTRYDDPGKKVLNVIVHVRPFSEPGDGVIYDRFADDALYSIHITHPATGATTLRYDFRFSPVTSGYKNLDTILSYGLGAEAGPILDVDDARQNYTQTFDVTRVLGTSHTVIGSELLTPPPNVGKRTTPEYNDAQGRAVSGASTFSGLDRYTRQTIHALAGGEVVFAGPREDGFFADTPGIFDLLDPRIIAGGLGQAGTGVDGFKGYNVLAYAIQIPLAMLSTSNYQAAFADLAKPLPAAGTAHGVGVYASVSRQRITLRSTGGTPIGSGPFVQVNRMGNPLFNEVLVALRDKDRYNRTAPTGDAAFATYAENPEVAVLINLVLFGDPQGDGPLATTGRGDLRLVYIPDVIRVDTTTPPVRLAGQNGFSRFGFAGGDTTLDSSGRLKSSGWPNGRRLGDDVVDIALTAVASGPTYSSVTVVGDNIAGNDQVYHQVFPYSATPHAGPTNRKDP
jgi:hypothetical protein